VFADFVANIGLLVGSAKSVFQKLFSLMAVSGEANNESLSRNWQCRS